MSHNKNPAHCPKAGAGDFVM